MGIALDSPKVVTKSIGSLHSYIRHSLLLFQPTTIDSASVKAIHLENRGTHGRDDHSKRSTSSRRRGENPSCTHWEKEGHDEEKCWKLHPELRPGRNDRKGKQKFITIM